MRFSGRRFDQLREVSFEVDTSKHAEGSCLARFGDTHVLCTASIEKKVPYWMKDKGLGWVTAEYGMLPRSTNTRMNREAKIGKQTGRTLEIQRLIGRSLRAIVDPELMGEIQVRVDCDVIQADGGTRTASITGGYIALHRALNHCQNTGLIKKTPLITQVAAISCGLSNDNILLDLDYEEDSQSDTDANFVLTATGNIIEIQATAEKSPFSEANFLMLLNTAKKGISELFILQHDALSKV